jgi:hypothetical protein
MLASEMPLAAGVFFDRCVLMPHADGNDKYVRWLEILAASSTFLIAALVLYMVFRYKPR